MEKLKTPGQFAVAFGLVYLASAIVFLGVEASALRKQVPQVLAGLEDIPDTHPLLARVDRALIELPRVTEEISILREQIPLILEESAAIRTLVPQVLGEVKDVREAMVPVLAESAALRLELPIAIASAKDLVGGAKDVSKGIGKGAAQGAVEGTVKGIIGAPFEVLKQGADLITPGGKPSEKKDDTAPSSEGD